MRFFAFTVFTANPHLVTKYQFLIHLLDFEVNSNKKNFTNLKAEIFNIPKHRLYLSPHPPLAIPQFYHKIF